MREDGVSAFGGCTAKVCHVEMNSQRQNLSFVLKPSHSATQLTSLAA